MEELSLGMMMKRTMVSLCPMATSLTQREITAETREPRDKTIM